MAEWIESNFGITGPVENICSCITAMDAVPHYFGCSTTRGGGVLEITRMGTLGDWEKMRAKTEGLREHEPDGWPNALLRVPDRFAAAAHGKPDLDVWEIAPFH